MMSSKKSSMGITGLMMAGCSGLQGENHLDLEIFLSRFLKNGILNDGGSVFTLYAPALNAPSGIHN